MLEHKSKPCIKKYKSGGGCWGLLMDTPVLTLQPCTLHPDPILQATTFALVLHLNQRYHIAILRTPHSSISSPKLSFPNQ